MALILTAFEASAAWTVTTSPQTVSVTGAAAGDWIFVLTGGDQNEGGGTDVTAVTTATTGGSTTAWNEYAEDLTGVATDWLSAAVAQVTATGTVTVQVTRTASGAPDAWGIFAILAKNSAGLGNFATQFTNSSTQSLNLTVQQTGNAVMYLACDWDAAAVGSAWTPSAGVTAVERAVENTAVGVYAAYWASEAAGTRAYGASGGSGTKYIIIVAEILAAAASSYTDPPDTFLPVSSLLTLDDTGVSPLGFLYQPSPLQFSGVAAVQVEVTTGEGDLGLGAESTVKKVAVVSARCTAAGIGAQSTAAKKAPAVASGWAGTGSLVTAKKKAPAVAPGLVGVGSIGTVKKAATPTLNGAVGLAGASTVRKVARPALNGAVGLAGLATGQKRATPSGNGAFGLLGVATGQKKAPATGNSALGFTSWANRAGRAITAVGWAGIGSSSTVKKRSTPASTGSFGLLGINLAVTKKATGDTANASLGLAPAATARKRQAAVARAIVGLDSWAVVLPPTLFFQGVITGGVRAGPAATGGTRAGATTNGHALQGTTDFFLDIFSDVYVGGEGTVSLGAAGAVKAGPGSTGGLKSGANVTGGSR